MNNFKISQSLERTHVNEGSILNEFASFNGLTNNTTLSFNAISIHMLLWYIGTIQYFATQNDLLPLPS